MVKSSLCSRTSSESLKCLKSFAVITFKNIKDIKSKNIKYMYINRTLNKR